MTATYIGMNASTGRQISDVDHISQSIEKILTTPIGSRVMRREFGSYLPNLVDKPLNDRLRMQVLAASVMAINTWEPRVDLHNIQLTLGEEQGSLYVDITAARRDGPGNGQQLALRIPVKG